ncbi:MAG: Fic family protein [Candidatus Thermoplasmatota archaeon]|nr:Fic family protein [Candidatus Thermoplasmatota archaeon]
MKKPKKPINTKEILNKHHSEIFKLMNDKQVMEFVIKCNREYLHWDQLRYKATPNNISPEYIWVILKLLRESHYKPFMFGLWTFNYALLDDFQKKLHTLDMGTAGRLGSEVESMGNSRERYIISSLMEEAIASSQLEGAVTTRPVAKKMLRLKKKPSNYSEQMIVNGYQTLQKIITAKQKTITPEFILELHKSITQDTLKDKKYEGMFRDNNEIVVGDPLELEKVYYVPPDYKQIPTLIQEFCAFANDDDHEFIHPIIKGIILHFLMAYIHPFEDGNGRTARTLFYWYVLSRGYWLFEFMTISRILLRSRVKYGLSYLYTETDDNDLTYFIEYNLTSIEEAVEDMNTYIARKQKEQLEALKLIKSLKNINLRQAEILKDFIKDSEKVFVVNEIMTKYGVAYDTARNDLLHLTRLGYLEKMKIQKKFIFKLSKKNILPT